MGGTITTGTTGTDGAGRWAGGGRGPCSLAEVAAAVLAGPVRTRRTRVVAVDGPSASGKTTYARRLGRELGAPVLHLDDLYPGWDGLAAGVAELCAGVLEPLGAGRPAGYRRWSWVREEYAGRRDVPAGRVLVVEGVGAASRAARRWVTLSVWVEAPEDLRRVRALARDGDTYAPHWDRWAAQERALFASEGTREAADVLVDGSVPLRDLQGPYGPGGGES